MDRDGNVAYQDRPCADEERSEDLTLDPMHFDQPSLEPAPPTVLPAFPPGAPAPSEPPRPPRDMGEDLVTWQELQCDPILVYRGWGFFPPYRGRGSSCREVTRSATRRERCRMLNADYEEVRTSSSKWSDRQPHLDELKAEMAGVRCCVDYSRTSISNARAPACVGGKRFPW